MDATDRVRQRLQRLKDERRFKLNKVAARLGIEPSAVTRYVSGPTPLTLTFLEAVCKELNPYMPLGELVAEEGAFKEVNADEAALLRWLRQWPASVTRALLTFVAFFADEEPAATQTRNLHEYWRRMPARDREWFYGVAVMLREGTLGPATDETLDRRLPPRRHRRVQQKGNADIAHARPATDGDSGADADSYPNADAHTTARADLHGGRCCSRCSCEYSRR